MKSLFRSLILHILIFLARKRLQSTHAKIIGITGSVGKTTCKEAIVHILSKKFKVFTSQKSYNTEFGVPLTILEEESGESSPLLWFPILLRGFKKAYFSPIEAEYIVLEYGVDKPGDMTQLIEICTPNIAVITKIAAVHLAPGQFDSLEEIFKEKIILAKEVGKKSSNLIILNSEDTLQKQWITTYHGEAKLRAFGYQANTSEVQTTPKGLHATFHFEDFELANIELNIIGQWHLETILPALIIGKEAGMSESECSAQLQTFRLPPGRLSLIEGTGDTLLIDSSYNASPLAVKESLKILEEVPHKRRVFVFGNMNELGKTSEELHRSVAPYILSHVDLLLTVGPGPKATVETLLTQGFPADNIHTFDHVQEVISWYSAHKEAGDTILVKGSQNNVRLEHFVKAHMKHPELAPSLLVRQSESWIKK